MVVTRPTFRQRLAFKKVLEGSSIKKAMIEVGYSKASVSASGTLTQTKGWKQLIDKYISEEKLTKVLAAGLGATRKEGKEKVADYGVRHKYLETGLKIRGRLKEPELNNNTFNLLLYSREQQQRIANRVVNQSESEDTSDRLLNSDESEV